MSDIDSGGGAPTGTVIADGVSNAVFPDISDLDRANGRVSLRKLHVSVQTTNTDTYLGANVIVADAPDDPNVSVTLFSTDATFDTRAEARSRIESYLTAGAEWGGILLEKHVSGQRIIQIFQRPTEATPTIGETLVLVYNEDAASPVTQYVRVTSVSSTTRTYTSTDQNVTYQGTVVACEISDALRYDFVGTSANIYFRRDSAATKIRSTSVADAGTYCGVATLTEAVAIGDLSATVGSVYTQLVPSAQTEIPMADLSAAGTSASITQSANGTVSYSTSQQFTSSTALSFGNAVTPGSVSISVAGVAGVITDDGGQLYEGANVIGTIDYARGTGLFAVLASPYNGAKVVTFKPAASPDRVADTGQIAVTAASRAYNYIFTIDPPPAPGSVSVSYRANGRWYDLSDDGSGGLSGSSTSYGSGTANYTSGSVAVTLGALPDVGSSIMLAWNNKVNYIDRSGVTLPKAGTSMTLANIPVTPGSVSITWNDGTAHTAHDDTAGNITGGATGTINYATGEVTLLTTSLQLGGQEFHVAYTKVDPSAVQSASIAVPALNGNGTVTINLGYTGLQPGTIKLGWPITPTTVTNSDSSGYSIDTNAAVLYGKDDGQGNIIGLTNNTTIGTINYSTGIATFTPSATVLALRQDYEYIYSGFYGYLKA